ncbi:SubName: Full=Uncharacterized protein {ECO:0000313/EMBL:CCA71518.1} [Serendipita indica DSM 11827]|uniref:GYF domain-containing protein n=1 Tax=Serendipita indica (strain DSM 11827) TaxID=1109443 RepID=G4TJM5_SERID|nr:SubName: Full=Uncharacterized protein {ECO:0000313/EMBL:CCA71518.1} [Serendipita indica DSM 11827]CCA71518.1 hypothetical protein PIIN_05455 [Serendipita indica DSM 11827]
MPPKRPAPSDTDGLPKSAPKRARFAEPENDDRGKLSSSRTVQGNDASNEGEAFNSAQFADEVDASLDMAGKTARQKGKGAVKVEGYESDSTDDGEGVVLSRRKGQEDVDDDDMFNMGDEDEKEKKQETKKETKYLELGEIEGQEFGAEDEEDEEKMDGDEDDEASVSESEPEDEDDAERRKRAGMGFEISKFNMKEEMEEGKFAEDGMYVRSYDAHAVHDRWLEDIQERDMKKARRAKRRAEKREKERIKEEKKLLEGDGTDGNTGGKPGLEKQLLNYLLPEETVLEALARLGREKKKKDAKLKKKQTGDDVPMGGTKDPKPTSSDIDRLTALASALIVDDPDVYSNTYEGILRSVRRSGTVPQDWVPPQPQYEYCWAQTDASNGAADTVYGPFPARDMQQWYEASFFGLSGEKIRVRKVGTSEWQAWDDVFA